jgi:hypothetical protein
VPTKLQQSRIRLVSEHVPGVLLDGFQRYSQILDHRDKHQKRRTMTRAFGYLSGRETETKEKLGGSWPRREDPFCSCWRWLRFTLLSADANSRLRNPMGRTAADRKAYPPLDRSEAISSRRADLSITNQGCWSQRWNFLVSWLRTFLGGLEQLNIWSALQVSSFLLGDMRQGHPATS